MAVSSIRPDYILVGQCVLGLCSCRAIGGTGSSAPPRGATGAFGFGVSALGAWSSGVFGIVLERGNCRSQAEGYEIVEEVVE